MKKKWKKNQIMITALALMIAVAGYIQFSGDYLDKDGILANKQEENLEDLDIVTEEEDVVTMLDMDISDVNMEGMLDGELTENTTNDTYMQSEDVLSQMENGTGSEEEMLQTEYQVEEGTPGESVYTSATTQMSLSDAKLLKEQTRAQNKAGLLDIINNEQLAESAKQSAVQSLVSLTDVAERELAAEILLEAKGFKSAIVSISGETADVVLGSTDLTDAQRAQIEDIVKRKTGISAENIIISPIVEN